MSSRRNTFKVSALLVMYFIAAIFGSATLVLPAQAIPTEVVADVPRTTETILDKIWKAASAAFINAGTRAVTYALQKVAYDSAVWLASGAKGQSPLFNTSQYGEMLKNAGDEAVGAAIEELGKEAGMNLCKPPDIKVDLALRVGLRTQFTSPSGNAPTKPNCTLASFTKNWKETGASKFFSGGDVTKAFNVSLKGDDQSDFGFYTKATEQIAGRVLSQQNAATLNRQEGGGFKTKAKLISNEVEIPSQLVGETAKANTPDKAVADQKAQVNAALASNDVKVFPSILSIFLSTLGSNLIKNFQNRGILPPPPEGLVGAANNALTFDGSGLTALGRSAAQSFFSYLTSVTDNLTQPPTYDLISLLGSCPEAPGIYNCRAGDDLINAATQGLTIREAIKRGILVGDHQLIPSTDLRFSATNNDVNCYRTAYCLNNVKVLRQVRVLPLGFEIAVMKSNPDKPWRLKDVVDGFNNCGKDAYGNLIADAAHPYCHLIDPNWVLKIPDAKCNALARVGTLLSSDVPDRLQDCVDLQTCVGYDSSGGCANYAYCTAEKNTWKFSADTCESQYATCRTFQNTRGQSVSYLYRTLDTGSCNEANVGCTAYSLSQDNSGAWQNPGYTAGKDTNNGIYFNDKLTSSCSAHSAGCSAFTIASSTSNTTYLTKAPEYLKCYDTNPTTAAIDWPQTPADLNKVSKNPACNQFAQVCIPEETSCSWYAPVAGGARIPGRFTKAVLDGGTVAAWNDQCDARCVGYSAYREMPSNYSNGQAVSYIIPSSGQTCTAQDVGCSSFTNMSTTTGGVEKTEFFTYLRPCEAPSPAVASQSYITYEGSKEAGFQLKTYVLVKDVDGSPKYFYKDPEELANYGAICSESLYKSGIADPDCRQFNDPSGTIYYKLLGKTIPVTTACTPYRLNNPDLYVDIAGNKTCFQNGVYKDGSCFYNGLPGGVANTAGTSKVCSASVVSCAAYKGSTGNVVETVLDESFDQLTALPSAWSGGSVVLSKESTRVGGESLEYTGSGAALRALSLEVGKVYDLTFWAKGGKSGGGSNNVQVQLVAGGVVVADFGTVSVGDAWQAFHLNPVELTGTVGTVQLSFRNASAGQLLLDNIRLIKVSGYSYLVKNTLHVDSVCDSNTNDNLPGEALGCRAYTDSNNTPVYLTGFTSLCREGAIGCTALFDTYNSVNDAAATAYNVQLGGNSGAMVTLSFSATDQFSCQIPVGKSSCYVKVTGHTKAEIEAKSAPGVTVSFVSSTVYVPSDASTGNIEYLVANKDATCSEADLGCTLAGKQVYDSPGKWHYATTTIKNDPGAYDTTLCTAEAVGCSAYSDGTDVRYFKDPVFTGQQVCTYQTGILYRGATVNGWFLKNPVPSVCSKNSLSCTVDADCGAAGGVCVAAATPCYPNYVLTDGSYGLWSYGNQEGGRYQNFVGECPATADKCTQFIDHNDADKNYYLKKDDKLGPGTCDGLVSQRAGCALFDEADLPDKKYNTAKTYENSNAGNSTRNPLDPTFVEPVTTGNLDANVILQVKPDRECGEWLQCSNSYSVFDSKKNAYRTVCAGIQRCSEGSRAGECGAGTKSSYTGQILSDTFYQNRPLGWDKMEYSGYSLYGMYPLDELDQINFADDNEDPDWRLVKKVPASNQTQSSYCTNTAGENSKYLDRQPCGVAGQGTCIHHVCVVGITNKPIPTSINADNQPPAHLCRAYPEISSPFPSSSAIVGSPLFKEAHKCTVADHCDCDYTKAEYGNAPPRYDAPNTDMPAGVCLGGTRNGSPCTSDETKADSCTNGIKVAGTELYQQDGSCERKTKQYDYVGWKGFCVEKDDSRTLNADENNKACLTWFPIESLVGAADIYNLHYEAGYQTPLKQNYCVSARTRSGSGDPTFSIAFSPTGLGTNWERKIGNLGGLNSLNRWNDGFGAPQVNRGDSGIDDGFLGLGTAADITTFNRGEINVASWSKNIPGVSISSELQYVKREDIDAIEIAVTGSAGPETSVSGGVYYIFPNSTSLVPSYWVVKKNLGSNNGDTTNGIMWTGLYDNTDPMIFYSGRVDADRVIDKGGAKFNYYEFIYQNQNDSSFRGLHGNLFGKIAGNIYAGGLVASIWDKSINNTFIQGKTRVCDSKGQNCYDQHVPANDIGFCPIQGTDNHDADGTKGSWNAMRLRFDPTTHNFVGIDTAFCGAEYKNDFPYGVQYQITFKLKKWCTYVADTHVESIASANASKTTAAWTDRLWSMSPNPFAVPGLPFTYNTANAPFGAITAVTNPIVLSSSLTSLLTCSSNSAGVAPADCYLNNGQTQVQAGGAYNDTSVTLPSDTASGDLLVRLANGAKRLGTLFARVASMVGFDLLGGSQGYNQPVPSSIDINFTGTGDPITNQKPVPPEIHPLTLCSTVINNQSAQRICEEDTSQLGFTINGITNGDVKQAEASSLKANMDFYMFADKNQMPIRKVTIDWDDGRNYTTIEGAFRNQRGSEATTCRAWTPASSGSGSNGTGPVYTCQNDEGVSFGDTCSGPGAPCAPYRADGCTRINDKGIEVPVACPPVVMTCQLETAAVSAPGLSPAGAACAKNDECSSGSCVNKVCTEPKYCVDGYNRRHNVCTTNADCLTAPQCVVEAEAPDFGHIKDKTCDNSYFHAENTYYCSTKSPNFHSASECGSTNTFPNGCCIFYPRVQVIDNWGWCNGSCTTHPGVAGCYDGNNKQSIQECGDVENNLTWTYFGGAPSSSKIIVAP